MSKDEYQLAVADLAPFQNQAHALAQLVKEATFNIVPIEQLQIVKSDREIGPFIALVGDEVSAPLIGLTPIVEAMHRKYPGNNYLPDDPILLSRSRALSQIIEQLLSYQLIASFAWDQYGRNQDHSQDTGDLILETPPPLVSIGKYFEHVKSPYIAGEYPTLADCHMAALWWTTEDFGVLDTLESHQELVDWHKRCCTGAPFTRS